MRYISAPQRSHGILSSFIGAGAVVLVFSGVIGLGGVRAGSDMPEL
jgi:hypothetical protein